MRIKIKISFDPVQYQMQIVDVIALNVMCDLFVLSILVNLNQSSRPFLYPLEFITPASKCIAI